MKTRYRILHHVVLGHESTELQMKKGWFSFWKTIDYCPPEKSPYAYLNYCMVKYRPKKQIKIVQYCLIS